MKTSHGGVEVEDLITGGGKIASGRGRVTVRYDLFLNYGDKVQHHQQYTFRLQCRANDLKARLCL